MHSFLHILLFDDGEDFQPDVAERLYLGDRHHRVLVDLLFDLSGRQLERVRADAVVPRGEGARHLEQLRRPR